MPDIQAPKPLARRNFCARCSLRSRSCELIDLDPMTSSGGTDLNEENAENFAGIKRFFGIPGSQ